MMTSRHHDRRSGSARRGLSRAALCVVGSVLVIVNLAGCGYLRDDAKPLNTLNPRGPQAERIDSLVSPVFLVAGIVFVLVEVGVLLLVWRFRKRRNDDGRDPVQLHGNSRLEWAWTIGPAILLAVLAVQNVRVIWQLEERKSDAIQVEVIGQQWWWEFRYDVDNDGTPDVITANQMVIPVGRQIELKIQSNDVIHSFWIPALNGKKDAVPGRIHDWSLEASEVGVYDGQCTEFCGLSHAYMRMEVKAVTPADYDAWLKAQMAVPEEPKDGSLAASGRTEWETNCASCHQINGFDYYGDGNDKSTDGAPNADYGGADHPLTSDNAPNLTHLMSRTRFAGNLFPLYTPGPDGNLVPNESDLGNWLRHPQKMKPMAADQNRGMPDLGLTQEQIDALVAYLTTLK